MATQLVIGPRRKSGRRPIRWSAKAGSAWVGPRSATPSAERPRLVLAEPASPRSRRITGGLSLLGHLGFLAALVLAAALAPPELINQVIPVALVSLPKSPIEQPGSNREPAPVGPKQVGARRANAAGLAASQILAPSQASAMRREALDAARQAIADLNLESANDFANRPSLIKRSTLQAEAVNAQETESPGAPAAFSARDISAVRIRPEGLDMPSPALRGPQKVEAIRPVALGLPDATAEIDPLPAMENSGSELDPFALSSPGPVAGTPLAIRVDTDLGVGGGTRHGAGAPGTTGASGTGSFQGNAPGTGSGSGGVGEASGVVRCLESGPVQRYLDTVQRRTRERWTIPPEVPENAEVVLRFALDGSGTARDVRGGTQDHSALSSSARQALLAASPFPPLVDANRCLVDKRIVLTFTVPAR